MHMGGGPTAVFNTTIGTPILVGLTSATIGVAAVSLVEQPGQIEGFLPLLVLTGPVVLLLVISRPVLAAIAFLGFAFINPFLIPIVVEFGELTIRYVDIPITLLTAAICMRIAVKHEATVSREFKQLIFPFLPFLLYAGVSLFIILVSFPERFAISVASYLRMIVSTVIYATLLHMSIRNDRDMKLFQGGIVIFSVACIAIAGWEAWSAVKVSGEEALAGRFGGLLSGDSLSFFGVVPGLLILYAVIKRGDTHQSKWWLALLTLGLLGLFLNKSVGALFATVGAIAIYFLAVRTPKRSICISSVLKKGALVTCVITGTAVLVWFFRRADVESFLEFTGGSFTDHLVLAFAGLHTAVA